MLLLSFNVFVSVMFNVSGIVGAKGLGRRAAEGRRQISLNVIVLLCYCYVLMLLSLLQEVKVGE